jgi:hypothetical protein
MQLNNRLRSSRVLARLEIDAPRVKAVYSSCVKVPVFVQGSETRSLHAVEA